MVPKILPILNLKYFFLQRFHTASYPIRWLRRISLSQLLSKSYNKCCNTKIVLVFFLEKALFEQTLFC